MIMKRTPVRDIAVRVLSLIFVFMLMASVAILREGRLFGRDIKGGGNVAVAVSKPETIGSDGAVHINTSSICRVAGYSGAPVPVEITIVNDTVTSITPLENTETPGFFKRVLQSGILDRWVGKSVGDAMEAEVDAVTGATYSSSALIAGVKEGLGYYSHIDMEVAKPAKPVGALFYISLAVVLMAMVIPQITRSRRYRLLQQLLNVGVLGFWSGTFVNYTMLTGYMTGNISLPASVVPLILLFVAFIYPLFGRPGYYCAWVCPLGSLQELASRCNPHYRIKLGARTIKVLTTARMLLWGALMLCLWTGFWVSWIDYELFAAFIVKSAPVGMLVAGGVLVLLSVVIPRPYCRFVCPTGTLLRMSQNIGNK